MFKALVCVFLFVPGVFARQQDHPVLDDSRIMGLAQAGVSEAELIRMVMTAQKFDFMLHPAATDAMLKAGVSERVIQAMAARENGAPVSPPPSASVVSVPTALRTPTPASPPSSIQVQRSRQKLSGLPAVYVQPDNGFETAIIAAISNKHVPVTIVPDSNQADYILTAASVQIHQESGAGKIARCLFAYCAGIEDSGNVAVQLLDTHTNTIVWGYNVTKQRAARNDQSMAEAIAKHLKNGFLAHSK